MIKLIKNLPKNSKYSQLSTPFGNLYIIVSNKGLHAVLWSKVVNELNLKNIFKSFENSASDPMMIIARTQLLEYFNKQRFNFTVPLVITGTDFQKNSWEKLLNIPYGRTISYEEQASQMGDPKKARAVGTANSRNPISIIIPCHRVVAKNGELSGYSGGTNKKKNLIALEINL